MTTAQWVAELPALITVLVTLATTISTLVVSTKAKVKTDQIHIATNGNMASALMRIENLATSILANKDGLTVVAQSIETLKSQIAALETTNPPKENK